MIQFVANGVCRGAVYALVATGFGLIYGTTGVFHLAHGAVCTLSGYVLYLFLCQLGWPLLPSSLVSVAVAILIGVLIELSVYRPLDSRNAPKAVLLMSSLGVYIICSNMVALVFGNEMKVLRAGVESTVNVFGVLLTWVQISQVIVASGVLACFWVFLKMTKLGRICRAVADDAVLASVVGVNVERIRIIVFGVGSALAAVGSGLLAMDIGIEPSGGLALVLVAAVSCIVGGLHRFTAPALGGGLLGIVQNLVVWQTSARWESLATFVILILFLLVKPDGLLGQRKRVEEL